MKHRARMRKKLAGYMMSSWARVFRKEVWKGEEKIFRKPPAIYIRGGRTRRRKPRDIVVYKYNVQWGLE